MPSTPCVIPTCWETSWTRHRFPNPAKHKVLFDKWIILCGNKRLSTEMTPENVYKSSRICSKHFLSKDFDSNKKLKSGSVPSVYLPGLLRMESETIPLSHGPWGLSNVTACSQLSRPNSNYSNYTQVESCWRSSYPKHRFPNPEKSERELKRLKTWVKFCANPNLRDVNPTQIYNNYRICSLHFLPTDFIPNKVMLLNTAIPSLLLNVNTNKATNIPAEPVQDTNTSVTSIPVTTAPVKSSEGINVTLRSSQVANIPVRSPSGISTNKSTKTKNPDVTFHTTPGDPGILLIIRSDHQPKKDVPVQTPQDNQTNGGVELPYEKICIVKSDLTDNEVKLAEEDNCIEESNLTDNEVKLAEEDNCIEESNLTDNDYFIGEEEVSMEEIYPSNIEFIYDNENHIEEEVITVEQICPDDINFIDSDQNNSIEDVDQMQTYPVESMFSWNITQEYLLDVFMEEVHCIFVPCNTHLWCSKGYGADLRERFGLPPKNPMQAEPFGFTSHIVSFGSQEKIIYYLFLSEPSKAATYEALRKSSKAAAQDAYYNHQVDKIAIPKIDEGLNWEAVQAVLRGSLEDLYDSIKVCLGERYLQSSNKQEDNRDPHWGRKYVRLKPY